MSTTLLEQDVAPLSVPRLLRHALLGFWHELPRALVVGLATLLSAAPSAVLVAAGAPFAVVGLGTLPLALALTGAASFAAVVVRGERPTLRSFLGIDPTIAVIGTLLAAGAGAAFAGPGALPLLGAGISAVVLLVAPVALGYGALRGRRGLAALRGGLILVAYRPRWALSLLALACLGGFAIAASAGVLMLVIPVASLVVACALVARLLDVVDAAQGRS